MRRLWSLLVSMRTTALLIAVLAGFLVVNVLVPQRTTSPDAFDRLARSGPIARFLMVDVGLGDLATSPPFVAALALFFVNLAAVLVDRIGITARRLRFSPPTDAQVSALASGGIEGAAPGERRAAAARAVLETLGYRTLEVGPSALWGVKHRWALAGFPLFHAAFFVLAAGGVLLYLTRDVVTVLAAEGQTVSSGRGGVVRRSPLGAPAPIELTVLGVEVDLESGKPVELASTLRLGAGPVAEQVSRINRPAVWGDLTVLTEGAGVAPVLWLVDGSGAIVDRVAVLAAGRGDSPARITFLEGAVEALVDPVRLGPGFPERRALPSAPIRIVVRDRGRVVHDGELRPGGAVEVGGGSLRLHELRYFVGLRLVSERGGAWLVAGFLLSVLGIVWRMVWHRRELAITWGDGRFRIGGRSEYYPRRFRGELEQVRSIVEAELLRAG